MVAYRVVGVELLGHFVPAMKNLKDIKTNNTYKFTKSENQILQRWIVKKKVNVFIVKTQITPNLILIEKYKIQKS